MTANVLILKYEPNVFDYPTSFSLIHLTIIFSTVCLSHITICFSLYVVSTQLFK